MMQMESLFCVYVRVRIDIDPSMKLTSQQIDDLEQMIALHRAAAADSSMHTNAKPHHG